MRKFIIGVVVLSTFLAAPCFAISGNTNSKSQIRDVEGDLNFGLAAYSIESGRCYDDENTLTSIPAKDTETTDSVSLV